MNYKQLDDKKKVKIDALLDVGYSMRKVADIMDVNVSTISRYKNKVYKKREYDIHKKYKAFIEYLYLHYNPKDTSIDICVYKFTRYHPFQNSVTTKQVYNWINDGKLNLIPDNLCYKRRKRRKNLSGLMKHYLWNMDNKTVFSIGQRPKYIEKRDELGHLEIDSIIGKKNEYESIISIVDRCSRVVWLIKAKGNYPKYISNLIRRFIIEKDITVKSITTDNGIEFGTMGLCAKALRVKLYKCYPYASYQRGTNERMNALVRRYIPKGESVRNISQQYLDDITFKINSMPRKMFGYKTPYQIEFKYMK